jgi:hypothetical protein
MHMQAKIFSIAGALLATLTLHGCKHPLAIAGEGDIVEVNNSGRGCTLEQFQTQDTACTENEVSGDYFVNYKAVPRQGWRFVRWDGPCPPDSDFQHCSFNVSKAAVDWWDQTYSDRNIPPSTAVFAPITGETGYLLAGTPVAGVSWETTTQHGLTGLDGSFQYEEGETVRFTIGDALLGEVMTQEQVTPFYLSSSQAVTGTNLSAALEDQSFEAAINIAVLLQSLDHDADQSNGIQIRAGVADLFRGVKLELKQHWASFQKASTLRRALGRANRQHRFSETHWVVKPAVAATDLYQALEVDPHTLGVSRGQNLGADGNPPHTERFQYDGAGNITRHDDGTPEQFENWRYDANGNVIRHQRDLEKYGMQSIETWRYDANGNLVQFVDDNDANGTPDRVISYEHNSDGNVTLEIGSGYTRRFQYDTRGNLVLAVGKYNAEATPYSHETWHYDAKGNAVRYKNSQPPGNSFLIEQYNPNGNITRSENYFYVNSEFNYHNIAFYKYDVNGNLTRAEEDYDADGTIDNTIVWLYQYDVNGKLSNKNSVNSDASREDTVESWQYDASGRMKRYECNGNCDDVRDEAEQLLPIPGDHRLETWLYRADGSLSLHEIEVSIESFITVRDQYWFDSNGNLTRYEAAEGSTKTGTKSWRYDSDNNLMRAEEDVDVDGSPDWIETWQYDNDGYITRYEIDENGDGEIDGARTFRYEVTGWGHFFPDSSSIGFFTSIPEKPVISLNFH